MNCGFPIFDQRRRDFSVNTTARKFKNLQQQENRSVEFLTQRREGAKIVNSLTLLIDFAPLREAFFQTFCTRGFLQKPDWWRSPRSVSTGVCYDSTFNRLEQQINPFRLSHINSMMVVRFQNMLREIGNKDTTICKHLRHNNKKIAAWNFSRKGAKA